MDHNLLNVKSRLSNTFSGGFWMVGKIVVISTASVVLVFGLGSYVWAQQYEGRIPPRTMIEGMPVGGLDIETVRIDLQKRIDTILTSGITIEVDSQQKNLQLASYTESSLTEDIYFGLDETLEQLLSPHHDNPFADTYRMLASLVRPVSATIPVTIQEDRVRSSIQSLFPDSETLSQRSMFDISMDTENDTWSVHTVVGTPGQEFEWDSFFTTLSEQLTTLDTNTIELKIVNLTPTVFSQEDEEALANKVTTALQGAPYLITYKSLSWTLPADDLITLLAPAEEGEITLLDEPLDLWITKIADEVNQASRDARLTIEDGRVTDFVESLDGRTLNEEQLGIDLLSAITFPDKVEAIALVVDVIEPTTTTSDVNNLGIDEKLGSGTSSYRGSPSNRRGNIQNGVDLLNGRLIAPGETFSLIRALAPFEYDNGYLPELVIKGDKIEPEMGGGLCQIGTTAFRAVMNSGLDVVERRNHSLVVSYYNDPGNGNPGTDATLYEPAPDFKFSNNTDHYVLFQAENHTATQELEFTFWGTSDGREGSYVPPVVERWIPVGETQYIETTDLEPGEEECQGSHTGADTSFTYTVVQPNGEIEETVFESHYRPLPRICLVGIEEIVEEAPVEEAEVLAEDVEAPAEDVQEVSE